jgi:hypothetical protein
LAYSKNWRIPPHIPISCESKYFVTNGIEHIAAIDLCGYQQVNKGWLVMNKPVSQAVGRVFKETSDFVLIGLTGRTGSGCTTAAKILESGAIPLPERSDIYDTEDDQRKYRIVRKYIKKNWAPFEVIRVRDVITAFLLEMSFGEFMKFTSKEIPKRDPKDIEELCRKIESEYKSVHHGFSLRYSGYPFF